MTAQTEQALPSAINPIHGMLLAGTIPLYLGSVLSDLAYARSYQIQWTNFASWLIVGGLVFGGLALLCAVIKLIRTNHRSGYLILYAVLLAATWLLGFFNSLIHAKDAWAAMPTGLVLSAVALLFACVSTWFGFAKFGVGGRR